MSSRRRDISNKQALTDSEIRDLMESDESENGDVELRSRSDLSEDQADENFFADNLEDATEVEEVEAPISTFGQAQELDGNSSSDAVSDISTCKRIDKPSVEIEVVDIDGPSKQAGRKFSSVWDSFHTVKCLDTNKIISNICKRCKSSVSAQAQRMKKHLEKCKVKLPTDVRVSPSGVPVSSNSQTTSGAQNKKLSQPSIVSSVTVINKSRQTIIDEQLGRFIFSSNIPFHIIGNEEFRKFVELLNPAYRIPSDSTLSTTILDKIFEEVNTEKTKELAGKKCVIMQDGWSTNQNKPVIAHCLSTGDKSYFLSAEEAGTSAKTAEKCFEFFTKATEKVQNEFKAEVVGGITDNCAVMMRLQQLIKEWDGDMDAVGCQAHLFNLLGEHFTPTDLKDKIAFVQNYMRNHHFTTTYLDKIKAKRPQLPTCTRWNSQIDSFQNYCGNHSKYLETMRKIKAVSVHDKTQLRKLKTILEDSSVYDNLIDTIKILEPISIALDEMQKTKVTLAHAVKQWINLLKKLPDRITNDAYFLKQKKIGMSPLAVAAYLLHPKFKGLDLETEDVNPALQWLERKHPSLVIYYAELSNPESIYFKKSFSNPQVIDGLDPRVWWQRASTKEVDQNLLSVINTIFTFPASTGGIERAFSTLGSIMTKQRNRLAVDKASKLCSIHNHYKQKHFEKESEERLKKSKPQVVIETIE